MHSLTRYRLVFLLLLAFPLTGCLFRSRKVERTYNPASLKTATQQELIDYINNQASKLHTLQATVDIDTTVGGIKKGKITDYQQIRGYVLARKPEMLRMIGLMPIVRNRAFDMVSDGQQFKLWIPPKNRFIVGQNNVELPNPSQPLENIRPQQIYDALLIQPINSANEIAVMENDYEIVADGKGHKVEQPDYQIVVIQKRDGSWFLSRKIVFSRTDLLPHRQYEYDVHGDLATDTRYDGYKFYDNGINFPNQTEIWRPQEEYDITLTIVKLEINLPLPDDKFSLQQPPGAEVVHLGQPQANQTSTSHGGGGR
jgi:hypothetical protein